MAWSSNYMSWYQMDPITHPRILFFTMHKDVIKMRRPGDKQRNQNIQTRLVKIMSP